MSREDLVVAYVDGRLSRRVFIRKLVALGVTAAAAVTYADALAGAPAGSRVAAAADDLYPEEPTTGPGAGVGVGGSGVAADGASGADALPESQVAPTVQGDPDFAG